ncbi:LacI family DNA-binding transcriptional regulator [Peribacillus loiseleuriae]|uniref:LacI family DNA-binding transcriptional regulator n=1 Tax=Peribacillus loiseleuriae TaxID=1679170 RepID=UPI0038037885
MAYTIKDVAKKAGVSIATVSRVLNNQPGFSEKTKKKVQHVIEELGYEPNAVARGLINNKTHTIGVLFPELSSMLVTDFLNGIETMAHELGSSVIVCHTEADGEKTMKYLQLLNEKRIDGIIFVSAILKEEYYNYIRKMGIPMVLLSTESYAYPVPYVKVNDQHAAYSATKYLLNKGHKKIGMISGNKDDLIAGKPRIMGFEMALKDQGIAFTENNIIYSKGFGFQDGLDGMEKLMKQSPEISAIFAASDEIAFGALSFAYQHGIKIPDDVSIIGYDNLSIAEMAIPPLTTVGQPLIKMGKTAASMLFEMLESGNVFVENRILPHEILERETVREKR